MMAHENIPRLTDQFVSRVGSIAYRLHNHGQSYQAIADHLAQCGITTPRGLAFRPRSVRTLILRYRATFLPHRGAMDAYAPAIAAGKARADAYAMKYGPIAAKLLSEGLTITRVATAMTEKGIQSRHGRRLTGGTIRALVLRYKKLSQGPW